MTYYRTFPVSLDPDFKIERNKRFTPKGGYVTREISIMERASIFIRDFWAIVLFR